MSLNLFALFYRVFGGTETEFFMEARQEIRILKLNLLLSL